jgi:CshA-type fibril repeat protein
MLNRPMRPFGFARPAGAVAAAALFLAPVAVGAPAASPACVAGYGQAGTGGSTQASTVGGNGCVVAEYVVGGVTYFETFNYTGALQSWVVPAGAEVATFTAYGAGGGGTNTGPVRTNGTGADGNGLSWYNGTTAPLPVGRNGGAGGSATGTFVVTPGEAFDVLVGQGGIGNPDTRCLPTVTKDPSAPWLDLPARNTDLNEARASFGGGARAKTHYNTRAFRDFPLSDDFPDRDDDECMNPYFASAGGRSEVSRGATYLVVAAGGGGAGYLGKGGSGAVLPAGSPFGVGGDGEGPPSCCTHVTSASVSPTYGAGGTGSAGGAAGLTSRPTDLWTRTHWNGAIDFFGFELPRVNGLSGTSRVGGASLEGGGGGGGGCFGGGGGGDGAGGGGGSSCLTGSSVSRFTTTTPDGTYREGDSINITAVVSKPIADGAQITVTLDTGETVLLVKTGPYTLSGTYVVGAGATSGDLTVASYALTTPPVDADGLAMTSTLVPAGSNNIAGSHAVVIASGASTAPTAANDATSTPLNTPVTFAVIGNDASTTGVALDPTLLRLLDADGNPVTSVVIAGEGTFTVDTATGQVTFTPARDFVGTSSVTYRITDSAGLTATAVFAVTVTPAPAGAQAPAEVQANPTIAIPSATVLRGATLRTVVSPSAGGTVRVSATLAGRRVCMTTKKVARAGRMTVTCALAPAARAAIARRAKTRLRVTATLTGVTGKTATATRIVIVPRYRVVVPVTG